MYPYFSFFKSTRDKTTWINLCKYHILQAIMRRNERDEWVYLDKKASCSSRQYKGDNCVINLVPPGPSCSKDG